MALKFFSKIDLRNAFLQLPFDETSKPLTTITTPFGLFAYNFLPFGLSVSASIFQKANNGIISGIDGVVAYQNDVIVFATDQITHNQRLSALLDRFIQYNVRINDEKCKFGVNWINCLGFVLDINGIKPDPERLAPLLRAKSPSNVNQLRSVIGAIQYYSRFIPRFAERASSLFELIASEEFTWTKEHEDTL